MTHPRDVPETVARFSVKNETPPVTGAWMPGDDVGSRQFFTTSEDHWFALEGGGTLRGVTVAYETWGELDATASNAVLVCHALTGDSHASGPSGRGHPTAGWWDDMIGPGAPIDTDRWFVVCANVLGGCQGSTGPASTDPGTGKPFGSSFPVVSIRDMVRAQNRLAQHLGIERWMSVVGGSMGGMQALEWAAMYPSKLRSVVLIATAAAASAFQIAWSAVGRRAIAVDPRWRGGDYYDAEPGDGPHEGLGTARAIAQIHYRSGPVYEERFGRDLVEPLGQFSMAQRFEVERYLDYQGNKLIRRFDANSYLLLNKAMDLHDVGRGRGGVEAGLGRIQAPVQTVTISSDWLYPAEQQDQIRDLLRARGHRCDHAVVESVHGHDGFLLESKSLGPIVNGFISDIDKND